jgi:hypothetical protein
VLRVSKRKEERERESEREKKGVDKARQDPCGMAFSTSSRVAKIKIQLDDSPALPPATN